MKTLLVFGTIGVVCVVGLFVLAPWSKDYADQAINDADNAFRGNVRDDTVGAGAQQELAKIQEGLRARYGDVITAKQTLSNQEAKRDSQLNELAKQERILTKAIAWLDAHNPGDEMQVGGKIYDYKMVATDARARTEKCEGMRTTINALGESCTILANAITDTESKIRESVAIVQRKEGEIAAKQVQLAAWRTIEATNQLAKGLSFDGIGSQDGTTRYLDELDRRINQAKASNMINDLDTSGRGIIDWEADRPASETDLSAIKAYQDRHLKPADELGDALAEDAVNQ